MPKLNKLLAPGALFLLSCVPAFSQSISLHATRPTVDKFLYTHAGQNGARSPIFGGVGVDGFEDREAQFYTAFNTGSTIPTGLGALSYVVTSATLTLSLFEGDFVHDPTYDPITAYSPTGGSAGGDDPGRSIELYGVGYNNGFKNTTVTESTLLKTSGVRNLYATDFAGGTSLEGPNRSVNNNVREGFNPKPFAVGQVAAEDLVDGRPVIDADYVFTLDLANPDLLRYLQLSLNDGRVSLIASSMHLSTLMGEGGIIYPVFTTWENQNAGVQFSRLDLEVFIIPEPSAVTLLLCTLAAGAAFWRGGRRLMVRYDSEEIL